MTTINAILLTMVCGLSIALGYESGKRQEININLNKGNLDSPNANYIPEDDQGPSVAERAEVVLAIQHKTVVDCNVIRGLCSGCGTDDECYSCLTTWLDRLDFTCDDSDEDFKAGL